MPLQQDLENKVKSIYNAYSSSGLPSIPTNKGNLYELYIFLVSFSTLKKLNNSTQIVSPGGNFTFRCSPGRIRNGSFSYISFNKNGITYELRNGIEVQGYNMYHEMDVAIFKNSQLDNSRPIKIDLIFSVECKNHSSTSSLKGETRKYLGSITDLAHTGHGNAGCIHCGVGFEALFACPLNIAANHDYYKYLSNYNLNPAFELKPNSSKEAQFIQELTIFYNNL